MNEVTRLFLIFIILILGNNIVASEVTTINKNADPLRIVVIGELTQQDGVTDNWDMFIAKGAQVAAENINQNIVVSKINVLTPLQVQPLLKKALEKKPHVVLGFRQANFAVFAKKTLEEAGVPFISTMATSEQLFTQRGTTFGLASRNASQAKKLADLVLRSAAKKKSRISVGIVVTRNCSYAMDLKKQFINKLKGANVKITTVAELINEKPIEPEVLSNANSYDFVALFIDEVKGLSLVNKLVQTNYKGVILGGDSWSLQVLDLEEKLPKIKTICLVNTLTYDSRNISETNKVFQKLYKTKFGQEPNDLDSLGYDSVLVSANAGKICLSKENTYESSLSCINKELHKTNMEGVSGSIEFSEDGGRLEQVPLVISSGCKNKL